MCTYVHTHARVKVHPDIIIFGEVSLEKKIEINCDFFNKSNQSTSSSVDGRATPCIMTDTHTHTKTQTHRHTQEHKSTVRRIGTQGPNEGISTLSQGLLHRELNDETSQREVTGGQQMGHDGSSYSTDVGEGGEKGSEKTE